ncbi:LysR family transcriptional regulator [Ancylobacter amanitiformis]|uniref:DNA-binding transcriptional LysR family regulator n=1 Tax=Ancylobacter amanitiformis TaxID=217069 RepID=A0ABU0LSY0_9HYPH|nr:LysR family transcriptional regulator [Ancylobacter amanitiformis]MDQ0511812.1 DNA-binding transcriptional LysR family regulator [Ancylobacter amanitiformis]
MDFAALALLIETVTAGSLAEAARRLRLSPMKATRLISALEDELGVRLLHRTTRALSLTDEGLVFLPHARALVEEQAAALASVRGSTAGASGLLRVNASLSFGRQVLAPLVAQFMEAHPEVQVELRLTDALVDIVAEGIDLAIRIAELGDSTLIARRLADNPRRLVASPVYVARFGMPATLADLSRHACLTSIAQPQWSFDTATGNHVVRLAGRFTTNSIDAIHEACVGGLGIANLSEWNVRDDLARERLRAITLDDATPEPLALWAVYPSRRLVPAKVRLFIEALAVRLRPAGEGVQA